MRSSFHSRASRLLALAGAVGLTAGYAGAATIIWDAGGGMDTNWATPANWVGDVLPGAADSAQITGNTLGTGATVSDTQTVSQIIVGTNAAGYLNVTTGAVLSGTGSVGEGNTIIVGNQGGSNGNVLQSAGTVTGNSGIRLGNQSGSTGTYTLSGGTLTAGDTAYIGANGTGTLIQTGGTFNENNGSGGEAVRVGEGGSSVGTYTISGGTFNNLGGLGIMHGTMTVSGSAAVHIGSGERHISISSGGTLVIDGSRTGAGTNMVAVGHLDDAGAGATMKFLIDDSAIATPGNMRKIITMDSNIAAGALLDVGFSLGSTAGSGTWDVLDWTRTDPITANLSFAPGVDTSKWSMIWNTAPANGGTLSVSYAVPEPATLGLLGLGAMSLLARRSRRKA